MAAIVVKDLPTCLSSVPEIRLSKQWRCFLSRIYICTDFAVGGKLFFCGEVFLVARFFFFFFLPVNSRHVFRFAWHFPQIRSIYINICLALYFFLSLFKYTYHMVFHVKDGAKDQIIALFCRNASLSILRRISNYKSVFLSLISLWVEI